jgi:hypothetical protein
METVGNGVDGLGVLFMELVHVMETRSLGK